MLANNKDRVAHLKGLDVLLNAASNHCLAQQTYRDGQWHVVLPNDYENGHYLALAIKQFKEIRSNLDWLIEDCEQELQAEDICLYVMNEERYYNAVMRVVLEYPPELHEEHMNANLPEYINGMKKSAAAVRLIVKQAREELK